MFEIPALLAKAGCKKLTIEGGEPCLYPRLVELVRTSKEAGLTTCIISNGSLITERLLTSFDGNLDWLGLSIDSKYEGVEMALGRGDGQHVKKIREKAMMAHNHGLSLKLNTVVTRLNFKEDLIDLILQLNPGRYKAFQMLKIAGENDKSVQNLGIDIHQFATFVETHSQLRDCGILFAPESCDDMVNSYIMMLPDGRFYSNDGFRYTYSRSTIFETTVQDALGDCIWKYDSFVNRGGIYDW